MTCAARLAGQQLVRASLVEEVRARILPLVQQGRAALLVEAIEADAAVKAATFESEVSVE